MKRLDREKERKREADRRNRKNSEEGCKREREREKRGECRELVSLKGVKERECIRERQKDRVCVGGGVILAGPLLLRSTLWILNSAITSSRREESGESGGSGGKRTCSPGKGRGVELCQGNSTSNPTPPTRA